MCWTLPNAVLYALEKLNNSGYEAYVVGGCVRDFLMDKAPQDWDVTTSATPAQMREVFAGDRTIETGIKHGTLTVLVEDLPMEITTFRVDGAYSDGRHPDAVSFTTSLTEDLKRRDFTINAMAYHPVVGIIDPFGGREDLHNAVIRCVGDPSTRFSEDALRILRALRFSAVLGFAIDTNTAAALRALSSTLPRVSIERITTEFTKLLCGNESTAVLQEYRTVISEFFPEIAHCNCIQPPLTRPVIHARLAALFCSAGVGAQKAESALRRLRMDSNTIRKVVQLLSVDFPDAAMEKSHNLRLLNRLGPELIFDYYSIHQADVSIIQHTRNLLTSNACYSVAMLAIHGDDVIAAGVTPGPAVGATLQCLLDAVIDGYCPNQSEDLLRYIDKITESMQ